MPTCTASNLKLQCKYLVDILVLLTELWSLFSSDVMSTVRITFECFSDLGDHDIPSQVSYHCPLLTCALARPRVKSKYIFNAPLPAVYQWPPAASLPPATWVWGVPTPVALSGRMCQAHTQKQGEELCIAVCSPHMWSTNLVRMVRMSFSLCNQNCHTLNTLCKWCWYLLKYHEERELFGWVHFVRVPVCWPRVFILPVAAIVSSYVAVRFLVIFTSSVRRGSPSFRELLRG